MTHDFGTDFTFSTTAVADAIVRRACHRLVVDCCGVTRATPEEDRRGVDYWVITRRGRLGLDLKLRRKDFAVGRGTIDCVIELDGHGNCGWLLKPGGADLILFACGDTHRIALFEKGKLQVAVMLNLSRWLADGRARQIDTTSEDRGRRWQNRAVVVSAELLTQAIDRLELAGDEAANDGDTE